MIKSNPFLIGVFQLKRVRVKRLIAISHYDRTYFAGNHFYPNITGFNKDYATEEKPHEIDYKSFLLTLLNSPQDLTFTLPKLFDLSEKQCLSKTSYKCRDCAVVFNSGVLLNSSKGPRIDSHHCIFRINDAPIFGYEKDVGTRTTIRFIASSVRIHQLQEIYSRENSSKENHSIVLLKYPYRQNKVILRKHRKFIPTLKGKHSVFVAENLNLFHFENIFEQQTGVSPAQRGIWITTGFNTVFMALQLCDSVSIFGITSEEFCDNPDHRNVPYYYYTPCKVSRDEFVQNNCIPV